MSSQSLVRCPSAQEHQALLDDQLDDSSRQQILQHVQHCTQCQSVCESLVAKLEQVKHSTIIERFAPDSPIGRVVQAVKHRMSYTESNATDGERLEPNDMLALGSEFQLIQRLGRGAQGVVYQAKDLTLQREVVIKLLAPKLLQTAESVERFKREARSLASIQSPFVVPIFRVGELPSGKMFMVMEFVQGATLRQVQKSEQLSIKQSAMIAKQIAVGLSAVHHKQLVHRDIKPENILIDARDRQVRIADFGLAFDCNDEARITVDGALAGTPAYMSPEQVLSPQSVDFRSDIYSLGVVLYELLTSQVPFRGTTRMTLLQLVHEDPVPPRTYNEQIPKDLETICLRALSKDPSRRFQSAEEFACELDRYLNDQPIHSRPVGRGELLWRKVKKNPVVSSLIACVVGLVCLATAISLAYAIHYRTLKNNAEQNALVAKQQRDSALNTLVDLVFELQKKFDSDEIYVDEIQQSSLEIAMRGLEDIEGIGGFTNEAGLAMAVALRRLGQTLCGSARVDETVRCLEKSEHLLRQLLTRDPRNQEVVLALADTAIACDECLDSEDDIAQLDRYAFAVERCREIANERSPDVCEKYAALLTGQARCQMQNDLVEKALESLREAELAVNSATASSGSYLGGSHLPNATLPNATAPDATIAAEALKPSLLLTSLDVQMYYACAHRLNDDMPSARNTAMKALEQIEQLGQDMHEDPSIVQVQLCCFEVLGCLSNKAEQKVASLSRAAYAELKQRLLKLAATDGQEFAVEAEILMLLAGDRANEGSIVAALELFTFRSELAEARLASLPDDSHALSVVLDSQIAAAQLELERDSRGSAQRALERCFKAYICFERMMEARQLSEDDWTSLAEAVQCMLEGCSVLQESAQRSQQAESWARKILQWSNDADQSQHASQEDLKELKKMCAAFVRS